MSIPAGGLSLPDAYARSGLTLQQLWLSYLTVGASLDPASLSQALQQPDQLDDHEHNVIAQAINEHFIDRGQNHPTAYREPGPPHQSTPADRPRHANRADGSRPNR